MRTPSIGELVNFVDAVNSDGGERQYSALVTRNSNGKVDLVYVSDDGDVVPELDVVHASNREHIEGVAQGRFWF